VKNLSRRTFLKCAGATGAAALVARPASAAATALRTGRTPAVLVDTTRCVGCRACEAACSEKNLLPPPAKAGDESIFETPRTTDVNTFTVVNRRNGPDGSSEPRYVKSQCMHCLDPGCASACPAKALEKTFEGPVVYNRERCLGCRYCMLACPFDVPRFEYEKASPYVRKCSFCADRQRQGLAPACVEACPAGTLQFGTRDELLEEARKRIYQNPDKYVHHIYGENEVGGTSWLYITDVPFERLGFRTDLSTTSAPELSRTALAAVPFVLTLWPPLLMGLYTFSKRREEAARSEAEESESNHARE
jgi:formate dehydrogenase iron-sulfur subunit